VCTEHAAARHRHTLRVSDGFPNTRWFPYTCHLLNLVLRHFCESGHEIFSCSTGSQISLRQRPVFSEFWRENGQSLATIPEAAMGRWGKMHPMVRAILKFQATIGDLERHRNRLQSIPTFSFWHSHIRTIRSRLLQKYLESPMLPSQHPGKIQERDSQTSEGNRGGC
jgi:hypothetical protein